MHSARHTGLEAVLHVVVDAQVALDQVCELLDDLRAIFVKEPLELGNILELVEMLLEFGVKVLENAQVLVKDLDELVGLHLVRVVRGRLQLVVLLTQPLVELGHLLLVVFGEGGLLLVDDLIDLVQEVLLVSVDVLFALREDLAHELGQVLLVVDAVLSAFFDLIVQVAEIAIEVVHLEEVLVDQRLLRLVQVALPELREAKHLRDEHLLLLFVLLLSFVVLALALAVTPSCLGFLAHLLHVLRDALLAEWLLAHVYDRFRKMLLAYVLVHELLLLL